MSMRMGLVVAAVLAALIGAYQLAPTHAENDQEFARGDCEVDNKCS